MSDSAPLPGSTARLSPGVRGQRGLGGKMQPALFHARERRLERLVRQGLTFEDNGGLFAPDPAITSPLTLAQTQSAGSLIARFEHFGIPDGTIFETGDAAFGSTLAISAGDLTLTIISNSVTEVSVSTPLPVVGSGVHTYVFSAYPDPAGDQSVELAAKVWVDGTLVFDESGTTTADATIAWASSTADWGYGQLTNVGPISDLEIYIGQLPALF